MENVTRYMGMVRTVMKDLIWEIQDFRYLNWSDTKLSPGTPGCFLKAYEEQNGQRYYYKLSNYDSYRGVFGHECINELFDGRLREHDREKLLSGLDGVLHAEHLEKIWNMLWKRWERYVQICGEE